jgi:HEAT repeat protein
MTEREELFQQALGGFESGRLLLPEELGALSHLDRAETDALRSVWDRAARERRLSFLAQLHESELQTPRHDFNPIYQLGFDDQDPDVRRSAILSIVEDREITLLDRLTQLAADDPDPGVREAALRGLAPFALRAELGELPAERAEALERTLLTALRRPGASIGPRAEALATLGYLDNERVAAEIRRGLEEPGMAQGAIRAMGRSANPRWLDALRGELVNEDPSVREEVAIACGELGDEEGVAIVADLVDDPELEVRLAAIAALGQLGGEEAREILIYALEDKRAIIREAAEEAIGELEVHEDPLGL